MDYADAAPSYEDFMQDEEVDCEDSEGEVYPEEGIRVELQHPDIVATLDLPEEEEADTIFVSDDVDADIGDGLYTSSKHEAPNGIQQKLLWAVHNRLRLELKPPNNTRKNDKAVDPWLLRHLRRNGWWIRRNDAPRIAANLDKEHGVGLGQHHAGYYRKIFVWLPDVRWGEEAMPCCPNCSSNSNVSSHGFRENHFGRTVVGLKENYFMISKRYICKCCKKKSEDLTKKIKAMKEIGGDFSAEVEMKREMQYTHMGWNTKSVELMPFGWGDEFPAFLTYRAALDKDIIDMMRPMMNKGQRVDAISDLLLELHAKQHCRWAIRYEYDLMRAKANPMSQHKTIVTDDTFSAFDDSEKYNARVPTGGYLSEARKQHHETIRLHLDREVKKRPAEKLAWDVSYKEGKNLFRYCGQPIFKGLVTGINELGEVRISFHVVTDSQDQFDAAIEAFLRTVDEYGQPHPQMFSTDNPADDANYFTGKIPSLKAQQDKFDALVQAADGNDDQPPPEVSAGRFLPEYPFDKQIVDIATSVPEIDSNMAAMLDNLGPERVVGFDTETKVETNYRRRPTGRRSKVGLLQFAYRDDQRNKHVLLVRICKHKKIPASVIAFFRDDTITLAGNNIKGDLKGLWKDYPETKHVITSRGEKNIISLGTFARRRDVVQSGVVGLALLVKRLLKYHLPKEDEDKFSDWNRSVLLEPQIAYASKDALAHLDVYEELKSMPDLNLRLRKENVVIGDKVDFVPRSGYYPNNVSCMATRAATGVVVDLASIRSPEGIDPPTYKRGQTNAAIEIETIYSPSFIVPRYKVRATGQDATLADFGKAIILVPLTMLREHTDHSSIRNAPPLSVPTPPSERRSQPATGRPTITTIAPNSVDRVSYGSKVDDDDFFQAEPIEDLSSADIEMIRAANVNSEHAQNGKLPLLHPKLNNPPSPSTIQDKYSSVLGDPFHAINRPKVPMHHEHKKGYKVALQNAFFIWNSFNLEELEDRMRKDGMTAEQIESERYYNSSLYQGCIDRFIPPPKLLYWRVRSVFVMYGSLVDSKSGKT
ncbi:hypothetical protein ACHAXR_004793, partial [Thalassiosira sp. AJA248-18]